MQIFVSIPIVQPEVRNWRMGKMVKVGEGSDVCISERDKSRISSSDFTGVYSGVENMCFIFGDMFQV